MERFVARSKICDWTSYQDELALVRATLQDELDHGVEVSLTAAQSLFIEVADLQGKLMEAEGGYVQTQPLCPSHLAEFPLRRIRLGYLSAFFNDHVITHLLLHQLASHDRRIFVVYCYGLQPSDGSVWREDLEHACDVFRDLSTGAEIFTEILSDNLDIALDCSGLMPDNRKELFSVRVAALQLNYLAFPSPTRLHDLTVADFVSWPPAEDVTRALLLPGTFLPAPHAMQFDPAPKLRTDGPFRFCCLNQLQKLTPSLVAVWLQILLQTPDTLLLLQLHPAQGKPFLQEHFGPLAGRVRFEHRFSDKSAFLQFLGSNCDLFLDPFVYGSHSTALDVLWMNVPILTLLGTTMQARVAAGVLLSLDLPELVCHSQSEYIDRAVYLVKNPEELNRLREIISTKKLKHLFNTTNYLKKVEHSLLDHLTLPKPG